MAASDDELRVAATPYGVAVTIALHDLSFLAACLRTDIRRSHFDNVGEQLKTLHDGVRGLRTELDLRNDSAWGRQLTSIRADISNSLQSEIESVPGRVRRILRQRADKDIRCRAEDRRVGGRGDRRPDRLRGGVPHLCQRTRDQRGHAADLFRPAALRRASTEGLVQALRGGDPKARAYRQMQVKAAIRFCEVLFGQDYASLMSRAAENAVTGERKASDATGRARLKYRRRHAAWPFWESSAVPDVPAAAIVNCRACRRWCKAAHRRSPGRAVPPGNRLMTLWFVFALMTAAAIFAVLWPLSRGAAAPAGGSEAAVYRDQLAEIERDVAAGLIGAAEAEAARVEIGRRLLAAADARSATCRRGRTLVCAARRRSWRWSGLPIAAVTFYLSLGSPQLRRLSARVAHPHRRRQPAARQPGGAGRGASGKESRPTAAAGPCWRRCWRGSAATMMRSGPTAIRITYAGDSAERHADLGEALAGAAGGVVTAEAKAEFERAVAQNADEPKARYFLGLAAEQDGRSADAAAIWRGDARQGARGCAVAAAGAGRAGAGRRAAPRRRSPTMRWPPPRT